jgi:uncharacterized membrane protein (UPF0136 family)
MPKRAEPHSFQFTYFLVEADLNETKFSQSQLPLSAQPCTLPISINIHSIPLKIPTMTLTDYSLYFGLVSIVLGVLGMVRGKSKASLIAGGISGLLLILGWYLATKAGQDKAGFWVSFVVSLLLLGRFLPVFIKRKQLYPAGVMALLAVVAVALGVKNFL